MRPIIKLLPLILLFVMIELQAQRDIQIIKFEQLNSFYKNNSDTVYVINFWATWCGPCVKELPEFAKFYSTIDSKKIKLLLVSLDFKSDYQKLTSFVEKRKISIPVVLLDETKYHIWIDKIEPSWEGAIPATLIVKGNVNFRKFISRQINYNELNTIISPLL